MNAKELAAELRKLIDDGTRHAAPGKIAAATALVLADRVFTSRDTILAALEVYEPWVSLEMRMPKLEEDVLIYTGSGAKVASLNRDLSEEGNVLFWATDESELEFYEVTHWRPLPTAPKEEE